MVNWKADLNSLIEETMAFEERSRRTIDGAHRRRTEPDAARKLDGVRARRYQAARRQLQGASAALHPGAGGLRRVRMEPDAGVAALGQWISAAPPSAAFSVGVPFPA